MKMIFQYVVRSVSAVLFIIQTGFPATGQEHTPTAIWLFPAMDWSPSDSFRLRNQLGYNRYLRSGLWYPQAFITVNKNIVLNPGYIYLLRNMEEQGMMQEHYLMNSVILQAKKKNLSIDDRNMIWNRFTVGSKARHYYRNRLRATQSFRAGAVTIRLYAYDEVFFLYKHKSLARNRAAVGLNSDLTSKLNVDILYIRQWDRYGGPLDLYFLTAIWQL